MTEGVLPKRHTLFGGMGAIVPVPGMLVCFDDYS